MQFNSYAIARAVLTALILSASSQATILNEYSNVLTWQSASASTATQNFTGANTYSAGSGGINLTAPGIPETVNYLGFYNETSSDAGFDTYRYTPASGSFEDIGSGALIIGGSNGTFGNGIGVFDNGIRVTLSSLSNITSVGFNFSAWRINRASAVLLSTVANPIALRLEVFETGYGVQTRTLNVPTTTGLTNVAGFFGFTTQGSITGIRLLIDAPNFAGNNNNDTDYTRVLLDNFAYGQVAASVGGGESGGGGGQSGGGGESGGGGGEVPEPHTYLLCAAGLFGVALMRRNGR
jgi:hypothetical protein